MSQQDRRAQFLLAMYSELWGNINRHLSILWESIGVLAGATVLLGFVFDRTVTYDVAATIAIVLFGWFEAHVLDSQHWYQRNLHIIRNIEREFLVKSDAELIHYYFEEGPQNYRMPSNLRIQFAFGLMGIAGATAMHFVTRIDPSGEFEFSRSLPYLSLAGVTIVLRYFWNSRRTRFQELTTKSPGSPLSS